MWACIPPFPTLLADCGRRMIVDIFRIRVAGRWTRATTFPPHSWASARYRLGGWWVGRRWAEVGGVGEAGGV